MATHRTARARWMGFTAPVVTSEPTRAAPALSARDAAIVDEYDALLSRVPRMTARDLIPVFQSYINLDRGAVEAYRAARG